MSAGQLNAAGELDWARACMDGSHVHAKKGEPRQVRRRSTGGKPHLICDGKGIPLHVIMTAANVDDVTQTLDLVDGIRPVAGRPGRPRRRPGCLLGDKAYDSTSSIASTARPLSFGGGAFDLMLPNWDLLKAGDDVLQIRKRFKAEFLVVPVDGVDDVSEGRILQAVGFARDSARQQQPVSSTPVELPLDESRHVSHCVFDAPRDAFLG
ncbi:transposase [Streptomyces sp. SID161]|uniref:transposase n=1 Tax=Streptomyces sp. SID161 TaxID=2690251 RepID=UPI00136CA12E|nr:transposase [Streptomyces sp. SID161]MYW46482.1 transposase [Streptomyces sp. SID161]